MHFARKEAGRFYLHPVDREYALSRLAPGEVSDRRANEPVFTLYGLRHRAAQYFEEARLPRANWKTIEDLAPQLAEFDLRCEGQDYETAGYVLVGISSNYLMLWGWNRRVVELNECLLDKLGDFHIKQCILTNQGYSYHCLGQSGRALGYHEQALAMSREDGDRSSERYPLVNLGLCYWALGQTLRAVDFLERAQAIMREVGDRYGEGLALVNLGLCYSDLGRMARAIDSLEQALAIAREVGQRVAEGIDLENLAWCHWTLGQTARAIEYAEQALAVARAVGDRRVEGYALYTLARLSIDEGRPDDAICQAIEAVRLGEETGDPMIISVGDENLALAHLCIGDLPAARAAAEAARKQDIAMNNHNVLSLSGLIALRQGDRNAAVESYSAAIAQAEMMLDCCNQNYQALDAKGLALAGLAVLEGGNRAAEAIATFQAARAITSAAGIVGRVRRLLDALAPADAAGMLTPIYPAAEWREDSAGSASS